MIDLVDTLDKAKLGKFSDKVLRDLTGAYVSLLCSIGDRLGIFKKLYEGPATSEELAERAGINERYAREWLNALYCADYLEYDPISSRFFLPPEHAEVLVHEGGPAFMAGSHQSLLAEVKIVDKLALAFKEGGGVPVQDYDSNEWAGMERLTSIWFENQLLQQWIPAATGLKIDLERGIKVADVGCGRGKALIKLAQAFPKSRYVGYDFYEPLIEQAAANAKAAGVQDRVSFRPLDVTSGIPDRYHLITCFDVLHDMGNPKKALQEIRKAILPDGACLVLEINSRDKLEDNKGVFGTLIYSWSIFYCMTTSLAVGGEGLGTAGLPEAKLTRLCKEAGFRQVLRLPVENQLNVLYAIKP